jgi:hypothetical protein
MRAVLWRASLVGLVLATGLPLRAQAADPLLMFLLGIAREMVISHATRDPAPERAPAIAPAEVYPGTTVAPAQLKRLIDECFAYLSEAQRREIFAALHAGILDPRNAAIRGSMIEYFAERALAVRALRERLAQLSPQEKERVAAEFRAALAAMAPEDQDRFGDALRQGLLPVPDDLGQMLLAALER